MVLLTSEELVDMSIALYHNNIYKTMLITLQHANDKNVTLKYWNFKFKFISNWIQFNIILLFKIHLIVVKTMLDYSIFIGIWDCDYLFFTTWDYKILFFEILDQDILTDNTFFYFYSIHNETFIYILWHDEIRHPLFMSHLMMYKWSETSSGVHLFIITKVPCYTYWQNAANVVAQRSYFQLHQ